MNNERKIVEVTPVLRAGTTDHDQTIGDSVANTAHTVRIGPYNALPAVNTQLNEWCAQQALQLSGVSWEVYGDWSEDQSKLVTELFFRLK
jgi:effector-binding domain-containing protein